MPKARLLAKHRVVGECWEWTAAVTSRGYGALRIDGRQTYAHRASFACFIGPIPDGLSVLHKCDNRVCINPAHLFLGTALENMRDREQKGRANHAYGERHYAARLKDADVREIRRRAAAGETSRAIAAVYGLNDSYVRQIVRRENWRHIA